MAEYTSQYLARLYDNHLGYVAKRDADSPEYVQWREEVTYWKIPNLMAQLPTGIQISSICEVGCATGELLCLLPVDVPLNRRIGLDISSKNVAVARQRFPEATFLEEDIFTYSGETFDLMVLSDVVEHVPDDVGFLVRCSEMATHILLNLPLESCLMYRHRAFGPQDHAGHLRAYSLQEGLNLVEQAGLKCRSWSVRWFVDQQIFYTHRRRRYFSPSASLPLRRRVKYYVTGLALLSKAFRHWYFSANLFALLEEVEASRFCDGQQ